MIEPTRHLSTMAKTLICSVALSTASFSVTADSLLNGIASYSKLGKERFIAGLYVDSTSTDSQQLLNSQTPQKMEMRVTIKRLSSRSLTRLWIESMAINNPPEVLQQQADAMVQFSKLLRRTLRTGDHLSIHRVELGKTQISLNEQVLGTIEQEGFFKSLLSTWVGSVPFSSSFKAEILTGGNINTEIENRFLSTNPTPERIAQLVEKLAAKQARAAATTAPSQQIDTRVTKASLQNNPRPQAAHVGEISKVVIQNPLFEKPQIKLHTATLEASQPVAPEQEQLPSTIEIAKLEEQQQDTFDLDELDEEEGSDEDIFTAEALLNRQLYHTKLVKWAYQYIKYPSRAIKRNQEGNVQVEVVVGRDGTIQAMQITEPAKHNTLNRAAEKSIQAASPFPPMPETMTEQEFRFNLPIVFRLPD